MGVYRINHANSLFPWKPGSVFEASDGGLVSAAVRAGAISRVDWEPAPVVEPDEPDEQPVDQQERPEGPVKATESASSGTGKQQKSRKSQ